MRHADNCDRTEQKTARNLQLPIDTDFLIITINRTKCCTNNCTVNDNLSNGNKDDNNDNYDCEVFMQILTVIWSTLVYISESL